eukprot:jgi/Tetstr1/449395/TSEL_036490.t1
MGVTPCFRIFESLHPNTGAMMPGPEWLILSYHVPGMFAFLPEVDHEDEARCRKHETARTMAAAKEMRHWNPEAHIGDNEYILADVKATAAEATAGTTDEQEMRRSRKVLSASPWKIADARAWRLAFKAWKKSLSRAGKGPRAYESIADLIDCVRRNEMLPLNLADSDAALGRDVGACGGAGFASRVSEGPSLLGGGAELLEALSRDLLQRRFGSHLRRTPVAVVEMRA